MNKEQRINVEHAQIHTASLSIRHLMVNNRKMTLSVFRQIMPEGIINEETLTLKGIPWGIVNYFWDGAMQNSQGCRGLNADHSKKINIVWQKGDELRRCVVFPETIDRFDKKLCMGALSIEFKIIEDEDNNHRTYAYDDFGFARTWFFDNKDFAKITIHLHEGKGTRYDGIDSNYWYKYSIPNGYADFPKNRKEEVFNDAFGKAKKEIMAREVEDSKARIRRVEDFNLLHENLSALPQIYIAV